MTADLEKGGAAVSVSGLLGLPWDKLWCLGSSCTFFCMSCGTCAVAAYFVLLDMCTALLSKVLFPVLRLFVLSSRSGSRETRRVSCSVVLIPNPCSRCLWVGMVPSPNLVISFLALAGVLVWEAFHLHRSSWILRISCLMLCREVLKFLSSVGGISSLWLVSMSRTSMVASCISSRLLSMYPSYASSWGRFCIWIGEVSVSSKRSSVMYILSEIRLLRSGNS